MQSTATYRTRYEVVLTEGDSKKLIGYTPRRSMDGLLVAVRANVAATAALLVKYENAYWHRKAGVVSIREGRAPISTLLATIAFGRTQRDALTEGVLESF